MRKIHILKAIVDYIWIVSVIFIPIAIVFIPFMFFYDGFGDASVTINGLEMRITDFPSKILISIAALGSLLSIYILYLFRKVLRYFLNNRIFDKQVIDSFKRIGNLLLVLGGISIGLSVFARIYLEQSFSLNIGFNSNLIILASGLFFLILSEVFKIGSTMKQENELTI